MIVAFTRIVLVCENLLTRSFSYLVVGVPYALATQGIAVGIILCLLFTTATMLGAILLVDLKTRYPQCKEFKDLGMQTMGVNGEFWASVVQNGNFFLFLPVAISFVALSAQDVLDPNYEICSDYFIIAVAGICFISTQIRQFKNAELLSMLSGACLAVAAVLILYIVATNDNDLKEPAQWIGNPQHNTTGIVKGLLGVTTAVWSYVPSFLVIEILDEVGMSPTDMVKVREFVCSPCCSRNRLSSRNAAQAIAISAVLNVLVYLVVGLTVVLRWGWDVDDPFTLLEAWPAHSTEGIWCIPCNSWNITVLLCQHECAALFWSSQI